MWVLFANVPRKVRFYSFIWIHNVFFEESDVLLNPNKKSCLPMHFGSGSCQREGKKRVKVLRDFKVGFCFKMFGWWEILKTKWQPPCYFRTSVENQREEKRLEREKKKEKVIKAIQLFIRRMPTPPIKTLIGPLSTPPTLMEFWYWRNLHV